MRDITMAGGRAGFVAATLDGTASASRRLADAAQDLLGGRVDVLVNNAAYVSAADTGATDEAILDAVWAVNVKAPFFLVAAMRGTPAGRILPPEAIAPAAVYLASDESQFVHGTVLEVDGGRVNVAVFAA